AVARAGGSLRKAAHALGLSPSTLYRKRERWLGTSAATDAA
ncbi:helix-turn-helix domain-containing protein, partial [Sandarakinorhabdus sp.]